ncbi:type I pantothenate kinase [Kribbella antibiotica]|uniref:Pantothenate kinase n=1 Tax=Kribbella antibiotica TaxID=190195 RepID=A0A4V2YPF0_9ACTN|nr:type I pantothenate kinase [Kribbella antibiotica]TDD57617.1 type I pantothenate kinase [Kribbella antibiotica]
MLPSREVTPYTELDRAAWAKLAESTESPLTAEEIERLRGLGDEIDLDEVREVYLPLSRILSLYVRHARALHEDTESFLGKPAATRTPFVIGIGGSVAVGKSTTARLLRELLARWPEHPRVALVTTDGFLWPNDELEKRGLMQRKGFPESYDRKSLLRFVVEVKSGMDSVEAPVYSHLHYDRMQGVRTTVEQPDILLLEGLNVLQPAPRHADGKSGLAVSDFFDFSVYVDAAAADIRSWYVHRFLKLWETAFRNPESYFVRYGELSHTEAVNKAESLWDGINGPNLRENILPTRSRATLVLRKGQDHAVRWVRLRKL